jgi:predicted ATPase
MGEFAAFLEVLRARCEVWEMEGKKDYRKIEREEEEGKRNSVQMPASDIFANAISSSTSTGGTTGAAEISSAPPDSAADTTDTSSYLPKNYLIQPTTTETMIEFGESFNSLVELATNHSYPIPWAPTTLTVYNRPLEIPAQYNGVAFFTFAELCGAVLGPADYITLASTYHTFIVTDVPVMGLLMKSEARRFITLLDAMYEARCRLMITAAAGPDGIFFPSKLSSISDAAEPGQETLDNDAVYPETYSEIYQDLNNPFRPNISSYSSGDNANNNNRLSDDALEDDPPNRSRQAGTSYTDERRFGPGSPDFANIGGLTGEDEKFAVKRAESRIWEMCSRKWWDRFSGTSTTAESEGMAAWWRPLPMESRHWEKPFSVGTNPSSTTTTMKTKTTTAARSPDSLPPNTKILSKDELEKDRQREMEDMFKHGASPFRTHPDAPPKFSWTHAWGKGVEGLKERKEGEEIGEEGKEGRDEKKRD